MSDASPPDLPDDIRALFDAERPLVPLARESRERLASKVAAVASHVPWYAPYLPAAGRAGVLAATFAVGAGVGTAVERHRAGTTELIRPSPVASAVVPRALPALSAEPAPRWAPVAPVVAPEAATVDAGPKLAVKRPAAPSRLADERAEIETARAALTRARWDEAAAALDAHQRDFPRGQLAEERDSLRVAVFAQRGRGAEARAAAARFERAYPDSLFLASVRAAANSVTDARDAGQVTGEPKGW
jgi:hypothetical protein